MPFLKAPAPRTGARKGKGKWCPERGASLRELGSSALQAGSDVHSEEGGWWQALHLSRSQTDTSKAAAGFGFPISCFSCHLAVCWSLIGNQTDRAVSSTDRNYSWVKTTSAFNDSVQAVT